MPNRAFFRAIACALLSVALTAAAEIPRPSPDFVISMNAGDPISLSQYRGKVCVLAFILTTCPHCQKTVGFLSAFQNEYGPRGLQIVATAIDDMGKLLVPDFITRFKPSFPVGFAPRPDVEVYLQHPSIYRMYVPQLVFIDRKGVIRAQYAGEDKFFADDQEKHIREQIEAMLKLSPASAVSSAKRK
jgi:peroxiredoxin